MLALSALSSIRDSLGSLVAGTPNKGPGAKILAIFVIGNIAVLPLGFVVFLAGAFLRGDEAAPPATRPGR
jgi:hypothetical protein